MNPFSKLRVPLLASVPLLGLFGAAIVFATPTAFAALPTVTVSETWSDYLNDAPCGVAVSSPTEFNDNGVPAVEVGGTGRATVMRSPCRAEHPSPTGPPAPTVLASEAAKGARTPTPAAARRRTHQAGVCC